jgi:DNA-directed RNA polymerase subunit L
MDDSFRIRIQTNQLTTAAEVLAKGLDDLATMTVELMAAVHNSLKGNQYTIDQTVHW